MRITLAQLNSTVGDISGNVDKMEKALKKAFQEKSDLIIFPEMFITGYPPRDLLEKQRFIADANGAVSKVIAISKTYPQIGILYGTITPMNKGKPRGLYNSALLVYKGKLHGKQHKTLLPTYDVFDEARYFNPAKNVNVIPFKGEKLGVSICEDMWNSLNASTQKQYNSDPIKILVQVGATLLINISASPFHMGKDKIRYQIIYDHATKYNLPFMYVNCIGANDELIFDGKSMVVNNKGKIINILPSFKEKIKTISFKNASAVQRFTRPSFSFHPHQVSSKFGRVKNLGGFIPEDEITSVYNALLMGIKDYVKKCGFKQVVVGLSGGIDSAVTGSLATKALGKDNVLALFMPSIHTLKQSAQYAKILANNLGITLKTIPIQNIYHSYLEILKKYFKGTSFSVAEENIQARIRGNILMAFSNKFGYLVLSTGNKSELAVGYCTLYGDMTGGLGILSDVNKTMVYKLAHYINKEREIIPHSIISRAPSAELKPNQHDEDILPPYEILDQILELYIDKNYSAKKISAQGFDASVVGWVIKAVNKNEYKRRQAPPGLKVTSRA
ncbi:NAD+ synthase, partial [Patescibacteria group bacterium AH-259-L07]|nr:NAD+ synthase [Patescibacteria group bacterium AH-259-L07]